MAAPATSRCDPSSRVPGAATVPTGVGCAGPGSSPERWHRTSSHPTAETPCYGTASLAIHTNPCSHLTGRQSRGHQISTRKDSSGANTLQWCQHSHARSTHLLPNQRPSEVIRGNQHAPISPNQRPSEAIRGNQHAPISPRHPSINSIGSNPASRRSYLMREAIRGNQRSSEVLRGNQRTSEVIRGPQRQSEVIRSDQRPSVAIRNSTYISSSSPPHAPKSTGAAPAADADPSVEALAAVDPSAVPTAEAPTAEALAHDSIW